MGVIMPPRPVLEEGEQELCHGLPIVVPEPGQLVHFVEVLALDDVLPFLEQLGEGGPHALQARQYWRVPSLQEVDAHEHVGVRAQCPTVGFVDLPSSGPVLDRKRQLAQPAVDACVIAEHLRVGHSHPIVDAYVAGASGPRIDVFDQRHPGVCQHHHLFHAHLLQHVSERFDDLDFGVSIVFFDGEVHGDVDVAPPDPEGVGGRSEDVDFGLFPRVSHHHLQEVDGPRFPFRLFFRGQQSTHQFVQLLGESHGFGTQLSIPRSSSPSFVGLSMSSFALVGVSFSFSFFLRGRGSLLVVVVVAAAVRRRRRRRRTSRSRSNADHGSQAKVEGQLQGDVDERDEITSKDETDGGGACPGRSDTRLVGRRQIRSTSGGGDGRGSARIHRRCRAQSSAKSTGGGTRTGRTQAKDGRDRGHRTTRARRIRPTWGTTGTYRAGKPVAVVERDQRRIRGTKDDGGRR
mmetsp:Transcript_130/g.428  ORF Transcript_130/g.428 Transcript_130/m.428 type:complete len:460 (-) Transcript_130:1091-2470(-)